MKISSLTLLGFYLNHAADSGRYDHITIEEVHAQIEAGTILAYLTRELGRDFDLSMLTAQEREELLEEWQRMDNAIDAQRKYGVTRRGLCLLVAHVLESIQQRARTAKV